MLLVQRIAIGEVDSSIGYLGNVSMITSDNLATITTAGYLSNSTAAGGLSSSDIVKAVYSYGTASQAFGIFSVTTSGGINTLVPWVNQGNVLLPVVNGNVASFNGTTGQIKDSGVPANKVLYTSFTSPDTNANIVSFQVSVTAAALALAGKVTLYPGNGTVTKQYRIIALYHDGATTPSVNFSGGGGDRLLSITDGATAFSVIPAASLQTLVNSRWGDTGLPAPATWGYGATTNGASTGLYAQYSGGTTDYSTGTILLSGYMLRVQ